LPGDLQSRQAGAGNQEHSPAKIRRTNVASAELKSGDVAASLGKVTSDFGFPRRVSRGLLHDKPIGAAALSDSEHVWPKAFTGSFAVDCGGDACSLAGWAADDDVSGWRPIIVEISYVTFDLDPWKSAPDLHSPVGVNLTKRPCLDAGPLESDSVEAKAREKV
jgi:hypothetical protein